MSLESVESESIPWSPHISQFGAYSTQIAGKWYSVSASRCFWNGAATTVFMFRCLFLLPENCHWSGADAHEFEETVATSSWRNSVVLWLIHGSFFVAFGNKYCRQSSSFCSFSDWKTNPKTLFKNTFAKGSVQTNEPKNLQHFPQ